MKYVLLFTILFLVTGCSTFKQAQTDFTNFQKTIKLNAERPAVYKNAYF